MKILENLWQSLETLGKLRKQSKSVFQCFYGFFKFLEVFGNFQKRFKTNFQIFLRFFKIFGKSSEVLENVCNGSQELKSFRAGF